MKQRLIRFFIRGIYKAGRTHGRIESWLKYGKRR